MTVAPKKRRTPVLLITVASLAAATILYLEFFADPIVDPPLVLSDGHSLQVQFMTARTPFLRRPVFKLAAIDSLRGGGGYELVGREVRVDGLIPGTHEFIKGPECLLISTHRGIHVARSAVGMDFWRYREEFLRLSAELRGAGNRFYPRLEEVLSKFAERSEDSILVQRLTYHYPTYGKGD